MRLSGVLKTIVALSLLGGVAGCAAVEAQRHEAEAKQQAFVQRVDIAHIWVTNGDAPAGKPYTVLGDLSYSEPFSPDANDEDKVRDKLKKMAYEKYPDDIDAIIKEHTDVNDSGTEVSVSAVAIKYDSSTDRTALHKMTEGIIASPK
ncbi:MAG TPA: hypothetical protein VGI47_04025 [Candidatus Binataceae bacterium]|jgi:hypothetical protein